ncbi:hypothetical protein BC2230_30786 [Burkholderia cepacia]
MDIVSRAALAMWVYRYQVQIDFDRKYCASRLRRRRIAPVSAGTNRPLFSFCTIPR